MSKILPSIFSFFSLGRRSGARLSRPQTGGAGHLLSQVCRARDTRTCPFESLAVEGKKITNCLCEVMSSAHGRGVGVPGSRDSRRHGVKAERK